MQRPPSSHAWLASFAARLMQLLPKMSAGTAVRCAVASIHHAATTEPRRAAEIFAQANSSRRSDAKHLAAKSAMARSAEAFGALSIAASESTSNLQSQRHHRAAMRIELRREQRVIANAP
jgi:hypothetical protein